MYSVIKKLLKYFNSPVHAFNDAGERIESMRFSVPALRVGVLEYGPGQLQTGNAALDGKPVKLYYPSEAVSDEKFLKSLETAPVVVGGHDSTTNEQNKKIDGWAHNVFFDAAAKAAMIAGVVKGAKEVAYIKGNLGASGFGASAFVDIYNLKVENGTTPDGQEYNAIANDLRATHVALAPHVRDPENKIKVINAVCINTDGVVENSIDYRKVITSAVERKLMDAIKAAKAEKDAARLIFDTDMERAIDRFSDSLSPEEYKQFNSDQAENEIEKRFKEIAAREGVRVANTQKNSHERGEKFNIEVQSMDPKELAALVKNAVDEAIAEKNSDDRMSAMEETLAKHGDALNEINEKLSPKQEGEGENADDEKKDEEKEGATLENAKPSQEMVKAFSTAMNVDFGAKTPSFATLATLSSIKEEDPAARIAAVNAKFAELQITAPEKEKAAAQNAVGEVF
jgi:hypothetical protein